LLTNGRRASLPSSALLSGTVSSAKPNSQSQQQPQQPVVTQQPAAIEMKVSSPIMPTSSNTNNSRPSSESRAVQRLHSRSYTMDTLADRNLLAKVADDADKMGSTANLYEVASEKNNYIRRNSLGGSNNNNSRNVLSSFTQSQSRPIASSSSSSSNSQRVTSMKGSPSMNAVQASNIAALDSSVRRAQALNASKSVHASPTVNNFRAVVAQSIHNYTSGTESKSASAHSSPVLSGRGVTSNLQSNLLHHYVARTDDWVNKDNAITQNQQQQQQNYTSGYANPLYKHVQSSGYGKVNPVGAHIYQTNPATKQTSRA